VAGIQGQFLQIHPNLLIPAFIRALLKSFSALDFSVDTLIMENRNLQVGFTIRQVLVSIENVFR